MRKILAAVVLALGAMAGVELGDQVSRGPAAAVYSADPVPCASCW